MAPEQTARIEGMVDERSDYYSLGMTLYHLFLNDGAFNAKDRYELIHKQIAMKPPSLNEQDQSIPLVLSEIIDKLIQKDPKKRYQGIEALLFDVKKVIRNLKKGKYSHFTIASYDYPTLHIGQKIFGRQQELKRLDDAVKGMNDSVMQRVCISGKSGVGKTRLCEELLSLVSDKANVVRGKFDQHKSFPYMGFKQFIEQLVAMIIGHNQKELIRDLERKSVEVLIFVFEELQELFPTVNTHKLHLHGDLWHQLQLGLIDFFDKVVTSHSPLVIYLDDLQWADSGSLDLLKRVIIENKNPNLHLLMSYRDNELTQSPLAASVIEALKKASQNLIDISLGNLTRQEVQSLLVHEFNFGSKKSEPFCDAIYDKTGGNPFYVKNFVEYLVDKQLLNFKQGHWHYALAEIQSSQSTLNIAQMIQEKFLQLSNEEQDYIEHLAVLGSRFHYGMALSLMQHLNFSETLFEDAFRHGFIEIFNENYQFVHDQIHEYVYSLIDASRLRKIHKGIALFLEDAYKRGEYTNITRLTYHFNRAYLSDKFPKRLFSLNIVALEDLLAKNMTKIALELLEWIEEHLWREGKWHNQPKLALTYYRIKVKTLYLNTFHQEALRAVEIVKQHSSYLHDQMICFSLMKDIAVTRGKGFSDVRLYGNEILVRLGLQAPDVSRIDTDIEHLRKSIESSTFFDDPHAILKLPKLQNSRYQNIARLLVDCFELHYYLADIKQMQWTFLNIVQISFRYGNSVESTFGYVLYGSLLVSEKAYKQAYRFGEVALKLNHIQNDKVMLPKIHNFVANFVNPYVKSFQSNIALYQKSLHQSKINNDIVFGTWANYLMHFSSYFAGENLDILIENMESDSDLLLASGDEKMIAIFYLLKRSIQKIQGKKSDPIDEESILALWEKEAFLPALAWYGVIQATEAFLFGDFQKGLDLLQRYVQSESNEVIMFCKIRLHFIRALLLFTIDNRNSKQEALLQHDLHEYEALYKAAPKLYRFKKLLLDAQSHKGADSVWDVAKLYDQALEEARRANNPFYMGLAGVCAKRFWEKLHFTKVEESYLNRAIVGLEKWGAYAVIGSLRKSDHKEQAYALSQSSKTTGIFFNEQSLLKAFNAIAKVKNKNSLTSVLMQIILENAAATKGVLVLKEHRSYVVKSVIDFQKQSISLEQVVLQESQELPLNVVAYVLDQAENLVLENPALIGNFQYDPYIKQVRPAQCIVIPVKLEGQINGAVYLENKNLVTAFNEETLHTLSLLLTQASTIFENISLYENLADREANLNKAQAISHTGSWRFDRRNQALEWSAETYRIFDLTPFSQDVTYDYFLEHIHPDDAEHVQQAALSSEKGIVSYDVVHRIVTHKGNVKVVHQRSEHLERSEDIMTGVIQDITAIREAEEKALRLSQVVYQAPFSTLITDLDGIMIYANAQAEQMSGYDEAELIGRSMKIFRSGIHDRKFYEALWKTIKTDQQVWRGTIINKMKNGEHRDCKSSIFPIFDSNHHIVNFVAIQEDVTEKNIQEKLFLMQTRQAQMGEMLSMIAHQWRQPLAVITTLTTKQRLNLELGRTSKEKSLKAYDDIEFQVQHLSQTINDFRDFFKPDKDVSKTRSSTIIAKTLKLVEHSFSKYEISVAVNSLGDESYETFEHEVEQVILNLLKNAQDALLEKRIKDPQIFIETDVQDRQAIITVEDNAGGIREDIIETLFLPYVSTKTEQNGTGLGLYMSKTIIEGHCHGSLTVSNTQRGAKFVIMMPLDVPVSRDDE